MSNYTNNGYYRRSKNKKDKTVYMDTTAWWKEKLFGITPGAGKAKKLRDKTKKELEKY